MVVRRTASVIATGVLLLGAFALRQGSTYSDAQVEAYHGAVADAVEAIPYRVGEWVGVDTRIPPAAHRLLRPNAILARTYRDGTGRQCTLIVVHCRDIRDMVGHYPPVCYPAHGWRDQTDQADSAGLADKTWYRFDRTSHGREERMLILNYLVTPSTGVVQDMDELRAEAGPRSQNGLGAAQVQILFESGGDPADHAEVVDEFERLLEPVLERILETPS